MVVRHLMHHWLRTTARQKIQRTMVETAKQQLAAAREPEAEDDQTPCDIAVVFALAIEAGGLVDLMDSVTSARAEGFVARRGTLKGRHILLIESGPGASRAARATETLIDAHRPSWVISAGFAGGLQPELKRHDIVMADGVSSTDGRRLAIDLRVDPTELSQGVHVGRLLSVDEVVRLPDEKQALGKQHDAIAVDLETFATAEVCQQRQTRLLAVRILTDGMDEQLPADIQQLTDQPSTLARLGAAVGAIWHRPSSVKDMMALKENALVGSDRLAKFLVGVIETLVPPAE